MQSTAQKSSEKTSSGPVKKQKSSGPEQAVVQHEIKPLWAQLQAELSVGRPDDHYERQIDHVAERAVEVTVGEDTRLTYQELCTKSAFGGEVNLRGLSSAVLSDFVVINEKAGLFVDNPHWSTDSLAADKRDPFAATE